MEENMRNVLLVCILIAPLVLAGCGGGGGGGGGAGKGAKRNIANILMFGLLLSEINLMLALRSFV